MCIILNNTKFKKVILSGMFLAVGIILPFFTAQIKDIGNTLLPMHIPVMLCGLICGPQYGLLVGFVLPFLRAVIFAMPPLYPNAVWISFELATYGFVIGFLYSRKRTECISYLYFCLITSMVAGRIVWGIVKAAVLGFGGEIFTLQAFIAGGLLDAIPGIVIQLIVIPVIMSIIKEKVK